jgi:hypothetical protein
MGSLAVYGFLTELSLGANVTRENAPRLPKLRMPG